MNLREYLARIRPAATTSVLFGTLRTAAMNAGLRHLAYLALRDHERYGAHASRPAVMTTYPETWVAHYFERGYHRVDPVLRHTSGIGVPYLWSWLPEIRKLDDRERRVLDEAREAGLRQGMAVPLIGPYDTCALFAYATGNVDADLEPHLGRFGLYAALFHVAFVEVAGIGYRTPQAEALTAMERRCLKWVARGKSSWEIGKILGIGETTVRTHLRRALRKLDVRTRAMAVARAMRLGLLDE